MQRAIWRLELIPWPVDEAWAITGLAQLSSGCASGNGSHRGAEEYHSNERELAMAAAVQMLSSRLYVITRPLSSLVHISYRSSARPLRSGLQVDAARRPAAAGSLPSRIAPIERFCRATSGTTDEAALELKDVNGYDGDKAIQGVDSGKFQHNNYGRKEVVESDKSKDYLKLTDKELFAQCKMDTYRASGPGGQHRNKTDSAVRLKHIPTGLVTQACEDRSQHNNRALALGRMRQLIAVEVRENVELEGYKPAIEVVRILPYEKGVKKDRSVQKIGPNHPDFAQGVKGLLDLLEAVGGSVSDAAAALGLTTGALSKLITSDKVLWQGANIIRASKGLKPLR